VVVAPKSWVARPGLAMTRGYGPHLAKQSPSAPRGETAAHPDAKLERLATCLALPAIKRADTYPRVPATRIVPAPVE
jgi:hypothetical protein